jgi:hypothetical protein
MIRGSMSRMKMRGWGAAQPLVAVGGYGDFGGHFIFKGAATARECIMARTARSELRSLGQAEAYPTKTPDFLAWGKLQLCPAGRQPGQPSGPPKAMKLDL